MTDLKHMLDIDVNTYNFYFRGNYAGQKPYTEGSGSSGSSVSGSSDSTCKW